jgi:hypothetical protein
LAFGRSSGVGLELRAGRVELEEVDDLEPLVVFRPQSDVDQQVSDALLDLGHGRNERQRLTDDSSIGAIRSAVTQASPEQGPAILPGLTGTGLEEELIVDLDPGH